MWKVVNAKYPEADYKQFLVRLKKLSHDHSEIEYAKGRYRLNANVELASSFCVDIDLRLDVCKAWYVGH